MADRIVGPLTLVQFLYLLTGGIGVYFLFTTIAPVSFGFFLMMAVPLIIFTFALTFLKIQDQSFGKFVKAFVVYLSRPKARTWFKEGVDANLIITPEKIEKKTTVQHKVIKKSELDKLIQVLDTGGHIPHAAVAHKAPAAHPAAQARSAAGHHHKTAWKPPTLDAVRKK